MSAITLESPDQSAPYQDWLAWLEELREMPPSTAVNAAIRSAKKMVENHRNKSRKTRSRELHEEF